MLFFLIVLETMTKFLIFSLTFSHNYPERHRDSTFLFDLLKNTIYFFILGKKKTLKVAKKFDSLFIKGI